MERKITPEAKKQEEAIRQILKLLKDNNLTLNIEHQMVIVPMKPRQGGGSQ